MHQAYEHHFYNHMDKLCKDVGDVSHDISHVKRVVHNAKKLAELEGADLDVVAPAAYLHDCVYISKDDPRRSQASTISADFAMGLLKKWGYPIEHFESIHHAIRAHSFSANIPAETLEAKIVQDADRIDALGAIGICRTMAFTGFMKRPVYNLDDPFCENSREPNDLTNSVDHFYIKLLKLADQACTDSGKKECMLRTDFIKSFLDQLKKEIL